MAAILTGSTRSLEAVPRHRPLEPTRPVLRVLEGGAGRAGGRPGSLVYWRRRALVLAVAVAALTLLFLLARAAGAGPEEAGAPSAPASSLVSGAVHVAQPGDTYWSIGVAVADSGDDVRSVVDALQAANGGGPLQVGDRLVLPD